MTGGCILSGARLGEPAAAGAKNNNTFDVGRRWRCRPRRMAAARQRQRKEQRPGICSFSSFCSQPWPNNSAAAAPGRRGFTVAALTGSEHGAAPGRRGRPDTEAHWQ